MSTIGDLDTTKKSPGSLRTVHKYYQQASNDALAKDTNILDLGTVQKHAGHPKLSVVRDFSRRDQAMLFASLESPPRTSDSLEIGDLKVYEHKDLPGKSDLANPKHKTNVHFHHQIPYDRLSSNTGGNESRLQDSGKLSFFDFAPDSSLLFPAADPDAHKPLTLSQFLRRKLRWMTLGGQYDWTNKAYPDGPQPAFPEDVAHLIQGPFPHVRPEAAIVNVYSPGDTLSIHRDVSESCDAGLVSISLGCDALFLVGLEHPGTTDVTYVIVRLRSGDAVLMSGPSRFAWHSVPQIVANTCPPHLSDWPADQSSRNTPSQSNDKYEAWRGWMDNKRINVNVRQMRD